MLQGLKSKPQVFCDQKVYCEIVSRDAQKRSNITETGGHFTCFNVLWLGSVPNVSEGYYSSVLCYVFFLVP